MSAEMDRHVDMVDIEVDGIPMQAPKGSMIIAGATTWMRT